MTRDIALSLTQDGLTKGIIYGLVALSFLLVFLVTRIVWVPAGDFVSYGALTFAALQQGSVSRVVLLLASVAGVTLVVETKRCWSAGHWREWKRNASLIAAAPIIAAVLVQFEVSGSASLPFQIVLTLLVIAPLPPMIYHVAFRPLAGSSILMLLFVAVAVHFTLTSLGLAIFGAEGFRTAPFVAGRVDIGITRVSLHLLLVLGIGIFLVLVFWAIFARTLWGKALIAVAVNRRGARLVGIRPEVAGTTVLLIAGLTTVVSGILIAPLTAVYYDSGFLIGLKGLVGAVIGGLVNFPLTLAGAIFVGVFESFASFFASAMKDALVFTILLPILLLRSIVEGRRHSAEETT
jgi:branched-chain amino acid transport system permease protein